MNGIGDRITTVINWNAKCKYNEGVSHASPKADNSKFQLKYREEGRKLLQIEATYREEIMNTKRYE
jgi:hypothetical protein